MTEIFIFWHLFLHLVHELWATGCYNSNDDGDDDGDVETIAGGQLA